MSFRTYNDLKIWLVIFFTIFVSSCVSVRENQQQKLIDLNLVKYQPETYEEIMNHPGVVTYERHQHCIKILSKYKYSFYSLKYKSGNLNIKAIVGLPPDFNANNQHPLLVLNRGGNRNFGYFSTCHLPLIEDFALTVPNSIVVVSQFRGSYGSEGEDEFGGNDVDDVVNLIEWSKKASFIDVDRHYLTGWSRGGMMSYLTLKRQIKFKAAAVIAGPTDLFSSEKSRPEMAALYKELMPNYITQRKKVLRERSAVFWPDKINVPILIIHGTEDWRVSVNDSRQLSKLLTKLKKPHKYIEYENDGHDLDNNYHNALNEVKNWFETYK